MPSNNTSDHRRRSLGLAILLGSIVWMDQLDPAHAKAGWLQEHFPNPETNPGACRAGTSRRLCDPDAVLSASSPPAVEAYLEAKRYIQATKDDECLSHGENRDDHDQSNSDGLELQMSVALVNKMDLSPFAGGDSGDRENRAAETFARYVHDDWGVGVETASCGGAGVLLFLSIQDRAVYVSRGAALDATLTDRRLDRTIENMKDLLRAREYDGAILQALTEIHGYIEKGPPKIWERVLYVPRDVQAPLIWGLIILGVLGSTLWTDSRARRDYARARSQLNDIDRARAEALQGRYQCTSCPICLDEFCKPTTEGGNVTTGSDGQPIKLLRCGHCMDETCWAEWINSGRGTVTKCPICMQDVGENTGNGQQGQGQGPERHDEDRIMRIYRRERTFRLARLGTRYPRIVRPDQIQRWSQPNYDGALVRDPGFVQRDPALARPVSRSGGKSSRGSGFGGGSSGGGRGGRW